LTPELDPQFSFIEILNADNTSSLGRTAFLLSFEVFDVDNNRLETVMLGGFIMLMNVVDKNISGTPLPYHHMHYYIPKVEIKKNYPDVEILLVEDISAPTFVVCDYDSFNDVTQPERVIEEALIVRDNHFKWTKHIYFWLPFQWTCRDDSVVMCEFDNPPVQSNDARDNYFTVCEDESVMEESDYDLPDSNVVYTDEDEDDIIDEKE
jgi:hypothetical protein